MKILAIRGKNLASLSAEFEIDFQQEPLASAGLYAIAGPTGSGKSTLLDALCLALYADTPRLMSATTGGIPDVGEETVTQSDPRTILRKGAGDGYAEVDFVGCDDVSYRSRWSVKRARSRPDGKLQNWSIDLMRIVGGQALGDHKRTDTLKLIEARIGLSFNQFTRAVLLAQNDFATLLKATDDERAELLQTLTGTEMFSNLSKQAYARMKVENEALTRLNTQLKDQQPMAAEFRAEKNIALQTKNESADRLVLQKAGIEGHLRWYQQWAQLQAEQGDASAKLDAAVADDLAAATRHAHLALSERVQPARPLWSELNRLTGAASVAVQTKANAAAASALAQAQAQTSHTACEAAKLQVAIAGTAKSTAQPDIDKARGLDASIGAITPQVLASVQAQANAQMHLNEALAAQSATDTKIQTNQKDLRSAQDWLAEHAQLRTLAEGWQRWDALFAQAQTTLASQVTRDAERMDLGNQNTVNAEAENEAQTTLNQATQSATVASAGLAIATQACAAIDADQLAREKKVQEDSRDHLQAAALLWQRFTEAEVQKQQLQGQHQTQTASWADSEAALLGCAQTQPKLEGELQSADQALHLAKLAASKTAESMRTDLQPEQPCPVCGSLEHPYASHSPVVDAMLQGLNDHVKACNKALRKVLDSAAQASANKINATKAMATVANDMAQLEKQHAKLVDEWSELALHSVLDLVPEPDRHVWLKERQAVVRNTLEELNLQEATHRDNLKRKEDAQQSVNATAKALGEAHGARGTLLAEGTRINQVLVALKQQLEELAIQLEGTQAQLDGAFVDTVWRQSWAASPEAFVAQCRAQATTWKQQQDLSTKLFQGIEGFKLQLAAAKNACSQATQQLASLTTACDAVSATLQGYRQERSQLFEGRALVDVEASLAGTLTEAQAVLDTAQAAVRKSESDITRLQEALRQATLSLEQNRTGQHQAQVELDSWLTTFNVEHRHPSDSPDLSPNHLQQLLAITQDSITAERAALHAIQSAVTTANGVLNARKQSLAVHEAAKTTAETAEALKEELLKVTEARTSLTESLSILKVEIARDDERLLASTSLRQEIEQQAAVTRVWSQLGELIGSADGKKFRNFAQQLTLDILLGYGNRHLQSLTSRYRLERIKDSLGLLVVDQDMGDEVRSVHSLSGGESFLVSLAMALGLASLSSHRVRVESLFIDEGFGSLDADSLRVAMDALDNLQAQGRKVGVISHVQEMTERIGTRVQVQRQAGGLSRIVVAG